MYPLPVGARISSGHAGEKFMATTVPHAQPLAPANRLASTGVGIRIRALAGVPMLIGVLCSFLGLAWDIQWHVDVGPDTFFTAPHLVLYSGIALTGLVCLAVTLVTTAAARRGDPAALIGTTPVPGGAFRAPLGYLVGGLGAVSFLLYGLIDQWWHTVYGFDVAIVSPPHVGLILSIFVTMLGGLLAFAGEARRTPRPTVGATVGFAAAAAILFAFLTPTVLDAVPWFLGPISWPGVATSLLYPAMLLLVASTLRLPGAATIAAALFLLLQGVSWVVVPWITRAYAESIGLFLRDTTSNEPVVPGMLPGFLLVAAIAVDGVVWAFRRNGLPVSLGVPLAGAVAALALNLLQPVPPIYGHVHGVSGEIAAQIAAMMAATRLPTLLLSPLLGALAGWFGWRLGVVLRGATSSAARDTNRSVDVHPVAGTGGTGAVA